MHRVFFAVYFLWPTIVCSLSFTAKLSKSKFINFFDPFQWIPVGKKSFKQMKTDCSKWTNKPVCCNISQFNANIHVKLYLNPNIRGHQRIGKIDFSFIHNDNGVIWLNASLAQQQQIDKWIENYEIKQNAFTDSSHYYRRWHGCCSFDDRKDAHWFTAPDMDGKLMRIHISSVTSIDLDCMNARTHTVCARSLSLSLWWVMTPSLSLS